MRCYWRSFIAPAAAQELPTSFSPLLENLLAEIAAISLRNSA
jgi:hypothetical protein